MDPQDLQLPDVQAENERSALARAVEAARADPRGVPHAEMRAWLVQLAEGDFSQPPPEPRLL